VTAAPPLDLEWLPREPPLAPVAVLARGAAVRPLAAATIARVRSGTVLRAAYADGRLLVLGAAADLPWADGVVYLGDDAGLLVPTTLAPALPADLVRRAVAPDAPPGHVVALAGDEVLTTPRPARPADAASLRWLVA
jgi:hypothetical protein